MKHPILAGGTTGKLLELEQMLRRDCAIKKLTPNGLKQTTMPAETPQAGSVPTEPDDLPPGREFSETVIRPKASTKKRVPETRPAADVTAPPAAATPSRPAASEVASARPAVLGRYEVRRTLGTGAFGTVYLGHDAQLDRPVAIKVLHADAALVEARKDQFLQESRKLAQLRHAGIVTVHDVGVHEGRVYLVSDYLHGPDLGRWLADNRVGWPEATRIAAAIADALAHAHARLIVHRDVKPANIIMLAAERTPVLVDFGLALDEASAGGRQKGVISGTPWYMSPEQADGTAHRIDGRVDIYSLGVVLYEMLTGRVPFRATKFSELLRQVRDDEPQPLRQLVGDIPPDLEQACLKALAKRQHDRYATAADFADDLRRVLATTAGGSTIQEQSSAIGTSTTVMQKAPPPASQSSSFGSTSSRRRPREAERRQVTVVVCNCDVFESEAYLELDAEDQIDVLRAFQRACEGPLVGLGGTVVQCNDQGLLACFGYPVAFEDGASRAAGSGLGILQELRDLCEPLRRDHKLELNFWVGIHTGPAVVESTEDAVSLVGEARNVALRLGDVAEPGQVICTEAAHRLFQGRFLCVSLGLCKIKGTAQPVALFRVQAIAESQRPVRLAGPIAISPLTGRDHEISLLKDRWEQAQEGMGQVVLLVGEPGLGKSLLVDTLKQHIQAEAGEAPSDSPVDDPPVQDSPIIEWRCASQFQNTGLYPARDYFAHRLGSRADEAPAVRFNRLVQDLDEYGLAQPDVVPLFASLLSLPLDERFSALNLSPVREREETFRALRDWLRAVGDRHPILFILEDLHWVDPSTLEFLAQFLAEGLHERILILLTFRPEFKTPWPAPAQQTSLALNRLTRRQVGDLMRKTVAGNLSKAMIEQIYDRTGGVPLFVEEFTKMVQDSGSSNPVAGGPAGHEILGREIPATLQDLVMARLDRMESERELAQLAATLGREFSYELLAAVADVDEPTLQAGLAMLGQADILYPKGRPPRCTYIFKHAILEDALYNSLIKSRRQEFHKRIAETLEARFAQVAATQPELLGHHFTEAGLTRQAVGYWLKAGLQSRERSADQEAIGHLTKGLALVPALEETRARDDLELQLLTTLSPAYIAVRGYGAPEVGPVLLRARELCQRSGDPQQLFGIMLGTWEWRLVRGDLRVSVDLAADGMAFAQSANDPGMLMEGLFMPGATHFYRARFAESRTCCETALAACDDPERTKFWSAATGHNAAVTHRCYLALALWHLGYPDQALKLDRETRALARSIGHAFSIGHALDFAAFLHLYCRLGTEAQAAAEEEMALGAEQGFQLWRALGTLHKGAAILLQGRPEEALPHLVKGFSAFQATGAGVRVPSYLAILGDAYTQSARYEEAHQALNQGLAVAERNDDRCHEAELHRLQGELLVAESPDQIAAAEECFRCAIETARRQQSRGWELRATMSLARHWQRAGRRDEARGVLTATYDMYTEGFTTPDLADATTLLKSLA
jgi:serine/threonine protein kinase/predicted ATPase